MSAVVYWHKRASIPRRDWAIPGIRSSQQQRPTGFQTPGYVGDKFSVIQNVLYVFTAQDDVERFAKVYPLVELAYVLHFEICELRFDQRRPDSCRFLITRVPT